MSFEDWVRETFSMDATTLTDDQRGKFQAIYDAEMAADQGETQATATAAAGGATSTANETQTAAAASRATGQRQSGTDGASTDGSIETLVAAEAVRATRMEAARINQINAMANGNTELSNRAIAEGWSTERFELHTLRAARSNPSGASSQLPDDEAQVMEAALLLSANMPQARVGALFPQTVMNRAMANRYRGFSLVECAESVIRRSGMSFQGNRKQASHMEAARDASNRLRAGGFSSFTLSSILENVADKVLLDAYMAVATTWQQFCAVRSLADFKIHSQYALDPTNTFKKVGPQGEFNQLGFSDRKYNLQADSYGIRFKIDFQTWRNDDLGAITNRVANVGTLGAATIEQIVYYLLMTGVNSTSLFHTNNANYLANSANYNLGITGMTNAEAAINNQVTAANTPLGVDLSTLLVGTALISPAGALYTSTKLNETTTADKGKASDNPFVNKYVPTKAPYLNNTLLKDNEGASIAHQSDSLWMLLGTMGNIAPIYVGFLDGRQSPNVEVINNQGELIGFELAAALHFGAGYGDPKLAFCANPANA